MNNVSRSAAGHAWYAANRNTFLKSKPECIVATLASTATADGWHIENEQHKEWQASVGILQSKNGARVHEEIELLRRTLADHKLEFISDIVLEYDFRRRGLRIDCILFAPGIIIVLEFKRSALSSADSDQVTNYCINLIEFHEYTRKISAENSVIIAPILVQTKGSYLVDEEQLIEFHPTPWESTLRHPLRCDGETLGKTLKRLLTFRRSELVIDPKRWLNSAFSPSSTILDAAVSLFGDHEVSAIKEHAGSIENIENTITETTNHIEQAYKKRRNRIIFISGAPGAGKTLVGLRLAFDTRFRKDAVFVTGNAPLVDVLSEALKKSYKTINSTRTSELVGYHKEAAHMVIENSLFKIVKAHNFLGERGKNTFSSDGKLVIFDEAQRTYEKGRLVLNQKLLDHEADLILETMEQSYENGAVVVALLGHNQAINRGERGVIAWLEAAERKGWDYSISDETLNLTELRDLPHWRAHSSRLFMATGHLSHSLRFYRNKELETWCDHVLSEDQNDAEKISITLAKEGHEVFLTRNIETARIWVKRMRLGEDRVGLIASGQARRLAAEGLFVDLKPNIAKWMLAPTGDIRSSNMLETVQNQYQIQGLELDYTIVCWDADLRRSVNGWDAWKLRGSKWNRDKAIDVAKNSYRVLLTRARKGMVIFVPRGDATGEDHTRNCKWYDQIEDYLFACGAKKLE